MTQSQDYIIALQSLLWLLAEQAPQIYPADGSFSATRFFLSLSFSDVTRRTDLNKILFYKSVLIFSVGGNYLKEIKLP